MNTPTKIDEFPHNITREWHDEERIVVFTVGRSSLEAIDTWYEAVSSTMREWPRERPWLAIQDLTHPEFILSAYSRQKAQEIANLYPDLTGRYSVLMPKTFVAQMLKLYVNRIMNVKHQARERRLHFDRGAALAWLREML